MITAPISERLTRVRPWLRPRVVPDRPALTLARLARTLDMLEGYVERHLETEHSRPTGVVAGDIDLELRLLSL